MQDQPIPIDMDNYHVILSEYSKTLCKPDEVYIIKGYAQLLGAFLGWRGLEVMTLADFRIALSPFMDECEKIDNLPLKEALEQLTEEIIAKREEVKKNLDAMYK